MIRIAAKCAQILVLPDAVVEDWRFTNITSVYNGRTFYAGGNSPRFNIFRTLQDEHIFDTFFFDCTACIVAIFTRLRSRKLNHCWRRFDVNVTRWVVVRVEWQSEIV
jgi:hypothetical protein